MCHHLIRVLCQQRTMLIDDTVVCGMTLALVATQEVDVGATLEREEVVGICVCGHMRGM